jgi:hypothetical protein
MLGRWWPTDRNHGGYARAVTGLGAHIDRSSDRAETVAHVLQPDAVADRGDIEAPTVVADLEMELISLDVQPNRDVSLGSACLDACWTTSRPQ